MRDPANKFAKRTQKALNHLNKTDKRLDQLRATELEAGLDGREWYVLQIQLRVLRGQLIACAGRRGIKLNLEGMPK